MHFLRTPKCEECLIETLECDSFLRPGTRHRVMRVLLPMKVLVSSREARRMNVARKPIVPQKTGSREARAEPNDSETYHRFPPLLFLFFP